MVNFEHERLKIWYAKYTHQISGAHVKLYCWIAFILLCILLGQNQSHGVFKLAPHAPKRASGVAHHGLESQACL